MYHDSPSDICTLDVFFLIQGYVYHKDLIRFLAPSWSQGTSLAQLKQSLPDATQALCCGRADVKKSINGFTNLNMGCIGFII